MPAVMSTVVAALLVMRLRRVVLAGASLRMGGCEGAGAADGQGEESDQEPGEEAHIRSYRAFAEFLKTP